MFEKFQKKLGLKLSCDLLFTNAENASVFRAKRAKPRFIFQTMVKMKDIALRFDYELY